MALTGAGVLIANSSGLGQSEGQPRGLDSDGTYLYALGNAHRRLIKITDLETFASEYASAQLQNGVNSLAFNAGSFYYADNNNNIHRIDPPFNAQATSASLSIITNSGQIRSLCSDGTDLFGYDKTNSILYRITDNGTTVTATTFATVAFPTGTTGNILSMFYLGNAFYLGNRADGNLWKLPDNLTVGSLGVTPVRVGNFTDYDVSESRAAGAGVLGSDAYFLGDDTDALHRYYNVRWDETIDAVEVDEGSNGSLDLSTVSKDATSFEFAPSNTARSWLTISGTELVITNAPDVAADTDFDVDVRAVRDSAYEDKTLTVRVIAEAAPPPPLNPPTFTAPAANYEVNERADDSIDSTEFFTGHTRLAFRSGYSAPSWLTISGLNVVITDAPDVLEDTDFTVPLTGTNGDGSVNGSITISVQQIDPAPVFGTPNRFDSDEGSSSVFDLSGDLQNTESLAYQSGYSAPSWLTISGLTLVITNAQQVSQDTDFDVLLAAESTKTAATADRTVTIRVRDVAVPPPPPPLTVPDAPSNLRVTGKGTDFIDLEWDASANNGGAAIEDHEVNVKEGVSPGTKWVATGSTGTTHRVTNLKPNTQYAIQVRSRNSEGPSPASNSVNPTTDAVPPGAPTGLKVELTPTTAVLKWAAATEGGEVEAYEVSYAEGASLGTTWIGTGASGTRFFVKRLKRGTQYTFGVRGRNSEGAGDASHPVTQNTPIASLHNALFFKACVNYFDDGARISEHGNPSNIIRAVGDNNYQTFTREKDMVLNIAVNGQPTRVDAIFVKGIDIEGHSAEPTGGTGVGYNNRMMPLVVKNWEGTEVSTVVAGFQHDLYLLDSHFTATSVRMTFTGANAKITEIMLLEFGLEIDSNADFTQINPDFVDRSGVVHPDAGSGIAYSPSIGNGRDKWEIDYVVKVVPGKTLLETPEEFLYWRSENRNHVHAQEPSRKPWRIFPAVFLKKRVPVRLRTDDKLAGEVLNFRVAEQ